MTDRDGRFSLPVSPGRHGIVATKPRFARGQATVDAGAQGVEIRLRRGAAISGRIIDEFGDPVVASRRVRRNANGRRRGHDHHRRSRRVPHRRVVFRHVQRRRQDDWADGASVARARALRDEPGSNQDLLSERRLLLPSAHSIDINWGDERAGVDLVLPAGRAGFQPFDAGRRGPGPLTAQRLQAARAGTPSANTPPPSGVIRGIVTRRQRPPVAVRRRPPGRLA